MNTTSDNTNYVFPFIICIPGKVGDLANTVLANNNMVTVQLCNTHMHCHAAMLHYIKEVIMLQ